MGIHEKLTLARVAAVGNFMEQTDDSFVAMWHAHFGALMVKRMIAKGAPADHALARLASNIGVEMINLGEENRIGRIALTNITKEDKRMKKIRGYLNFFVGLIPLLLFCSLTHFVWLFIKLPFEFWKNRDGEPFYELLFEMAKSMYKTGEI